MHLPLLSALLGTLFIALKLTAVIDWSWLWVLAPLWFAPVAFFLFLGGGLLVEWVMRRMQR